MEARTRVEPRRVASAGGGDSIAEVVLEECDRHLPIKAQQQGAVLNKLCDIQREWNASVRMALSLGASPDAVLSCLETAREHLKTMGAL